MPFSMPLGIVVLHFDLTFSLGGRGIATCKHRALLDLSGLSDIDVIAARKTSVSNNVNFLANLRAFSH